MTLDREAIQAIARALVEARLDGLALPDFPGALPTTLDEAYAIQNAAIALWPDDIAGWKVGRLSPDLAERYGVDRFIGPVFAAMVAQVMPAGPTPFPMMAGGSAAFEAEYVVFMGEDADGGVVPQHLHIGIEVASSPVTSLPTLGSLASIADMGNNAGQIIGAAIPFHLLDRPADLPCETRIDDAEPVARTGEALPGGPAAGLAFAMEQTRKLGHPLRAGQFISTGAVTGMHAVTLAQRCVARFGDFGTIDCVVTARQPSR